MPETKTLLGSLEKKQTLLIFTVPVGPDAGQWFVKMTSEDWSIKFEDSALFPFLGTFVEIEGTLLPVTRIIIAKRVTARTGHSPL